MPIGQGLFRKRPKNDLDDYLAEVDSLLFCVSKADRTCLNRDLKAHIKELTTDPKESNIYHGRYQISKDQLINQIGDPKTISSNYISSLGKKIPSIGLRLYISIIIIIFASMVIAGYSRFNLSTLTNVEDPEWLRMTGFALMIGGLSGLVMTGIAVIRFQKFHALLLFLALLSLLLSIPYSSYISNAIIFFMGKTTEPMLQRTFSTLIIIDLIIVGIIGVFIFLRHYRVMNPQVDLIIE
jgi:hypothetical protein